MKRFLAAAVALSFVIAFSSSALAIRWPDNMSYRVETMGGATLGIEDETTAINPFNHENVAGVALLSKMNRADIGLFYDMDSTKTEGTGYTITQDSSDMELTRPGAEYRGVTYWLEDNLVIRAGIEGLLMNTKYTAEMTGLPTTEEALNFSGIGGGLGVAYLLDFGLSLGAGLTYVGAGGKPDSLTGAFNVIGMMAPGGETTKFEFSATNLDWGIGAAYVLDQLGENGKLTLGAQIGADDDRPNIAGLDPTSPTALLSFNDYSAVATIEGTVLTPLGPMEVSQKETVTATPMKISAEAIYDLGSMLEAGVLIDSKTKELKLKDEQTSAGSTQSSEYKALDDSLMGITPIVRVKVPLGEDMAILPGISYTMWNGTTNMFDLDYTTAAADDTYKTTENKYSQGIFAIGAGLQAMSKQLQLALQYAAGTNKTDTTSYSPPSLGLPSSSGTAEGSSSQIRVGAEYWVIPMLAIRAGYAMLADTAKDVFTGFDPITFQPIYEDVTNNTSRITFGLGASLPTGLAVDLLVLLDSYTQDPAPDPAPTHTNTGVYLGARLPL